MCIRDRPKHTQIGLCASECTQILNLLSNLYFSFCKNFLVSAVNWDTVHFRRNAVDKSGHYRKKAFWYSQTKEETKIDFNLYKVHYY